MGDRQEAKKTGYRSEAIGNRKKFICPSPIAYCL